MPARPRLGPDLTRTIIIRAAPLQNHNALRTDCFSNTNYNKTIHVTSPHTSSSPTQLEVSDHSSKDYINCAHRPHSEPVGPVGTANRFAPPQNIVKTPHRHRHKPHPDQARKLHQRQPLKRYYRHLALTLPPSTLVE